MAQQIQRLNLASTPAYISLKKEGPARVEAAAGDTFVPSKKRFPWGRAALATLALAAAPLCYQHFLVHSENLHFPRQVTVVTMNDKAVHVPLVRLFEEPRDMRESEVDIKVRVPQQWSDQDKAVIKLEARDVDAHSQRTVWNSGLLTSDNINYDAQRRTLELHYRPSTEDVNRQGGTDQGFDPAHVSSLSLQVSKTSPGAAAPVRMEVLEAKIVSGLAAQASGEVRPLLGQSNHPGKSPQQMVSGVSRFYLYNDMARWDQARGKVEAGLQAQQKQGLHGFRYMGALDLRHQEEKKGLDPAVYPAMRDFLGLCEKYQQDHVIFSLIDAAIPNPTLQRAFEQPARRKELVETLRPFVHEFGQSKINGQPVVFDLVNEIHGTPGTEAAKQALVHDLIDMFIKEAPGARLTVGVQNFRELKYWTHLLERYQGKPVEFLMTFHLYEDVNNLPRASDLNLPANVGVGITEADPTKDMRDITHKAAAKGYDWLLFWADSAHPYTAAQHHQALR